VSALLAATASGQVAKLVELDGAADGDRFGRVAFVGDVNGDGVEDFAVGAYLEDNENGVDAGAAYVYSGRDASLLARWVGDLAGDTFGAAIANVGDEDHDGFDELAVTATSDKSDSLEQYVRVFSGKHLRDGSGDEVVRTIRVSVDGDFGSDVDAAGDVDGDGVPDLIVGSLRRTPSATVFSGSTGRALWSYAPATVNSIGTAVSRFCDVDGDGYDDFLVGDGSYTAHGKRELGVVRLYAGGKTLHIGTKLAELVGDTAFDHFGMEVVRAPDLDGDGVPEIAIGAPARADEGTSPGYVRLFSGASQALLEQIDGDAPGEYFGISLAIGDVDGDGVPDRVVAARNADVNGFTNNGRVVAFSGATGAQLFELDGADDLHKLARVCVHDVTGDGVDEVLLGSGHVAPPGHANRGAAYLVGYGLVAEADPYGKGLDGRFGAPQLAMRAPAVIGQDAVLGVSNSLGDATTGVLLVGAAPTHDPNGHGGFVLVDTSNVIPLSFVDGGELAVDGDLALDLTLCGTYLYVQAVEADPYASGGLSLSAGLRLTLGGASW
jgi:hypothetical protein